VTELARNVSLKEETSRLYEPSTAIIIVDELRGRDFSRMSENGLQEGIHGE
jgi:hypothetical protein